MRFTTNTSLDDTISIPREISIKTFGSQESAQVEQGEQSTIRNYYPSFSMNMQWDNQEDNNISCNLKGHIGCIVSLQSSDCSSQGSTVAIDPLDYRKDWTKELETDLTQCMTQNPELFVVPDEKIIDDNSLCSCLSEEYEMECDDNMTGLWDGENNDITIPDWIVSS